MIELLCQGSNLNCAQIPFTSRWIWLLLVIKTYCTLIRSLCTTVPTSKTFKFKGFIILFYATFEKDYIGIDDSNFSAHNLLEKKYSLFKANTPSKFQCHFFNILKLTMLNFKLY